MGQLQNSCTAAPSVFILSSRSAMERTFREQLGKARFLFHASASGVIRVGRGLRHVELTRIAIAYEPESIRHVAPGLFAEAVGDCCPAELGTAEHLFNSLIKEVGERPEVSARQQDARAATLQWFSADDPLTIAKDPECGYELPAEFCELRSTELIATSAARAFEFGADGILE